MSCSQWRETEPRTPLSCPPLPRGPVQSCEFAFRLLPCLFPRSAGIVPSCVEDLSNPVAEPSSIQAGSSSSVGEYSWPPGACARPRGTAELPPLQSRGLRTETRTLMPWWSLNSPQGHRCYKGTVQDHVRYQVLCRKVESNDLLRELWGGR